MNRYGALARRHWQAAAPSRVAEIPDPETFFETLGEQVETRIETLADALERQENPSQDDGYLETAGRWRAIRKQAEETALAELVWIPPMEAELTIEEQLGELPSPEMLDESILEYRDRHEEHLPPDLIEEKIAELKALKEHVLALRRLTQR